MRPQWLFVCHLVELSVLLIAGLGVGQSSGEANVTVSDVTAYSAQVHWQPAPPSVGPVDGYRLTVDVAHANVLEATLANSTMGYRLEDLDDMREYEACVEVVGGERLGCASFTTPMGAYTVAAVVSGVFLLLCCVTFGVLDFVVSKKRGRQMESRERQLLQEGWQTFKRTSEKKGKGRDKKRAAPGVPRPDSATVSVVSADPPSGGLAAPAT